MKKPEIGSLFIFICFFLTGCFSLMYQVTWVRLFTHVFGNTVYSVSAVVAAFMAGLGLGGWYFGRRIERGGNPALAYGLVEAAVGAYALFTPLFIGKLIYIGSLFPVTPGYSTAFFVVRFLISAGILLPPAFLMGASLPLLTKFFVRERERFGNIVSFLYGLNTLGAVFGVFISTFLTIRTIGISGTIYTAGVLNAALGLGVAVISTRSGIGAGYYLRAETEPDAQPETDPERVKRSAALAVAFMSGFAALLFEVAWTRTLALLIGSSVYSFSLILITVLAGISAGGLAGSRYYLKRKAATPGALAFFQFAAAVSAAIALPLLPMTVAVVNAAMSAIREFPVAIFSFNFTVCAMLLFVPTFFFGISFPVAAELYAGASRKSAEAVGKVYLYNTAGAIAGSLATGFVLITALGVADTLMAGVAVTIAGGIAALSVHTSAGVVKRLAAAAAPVAVCVAVASTPFWSARLMTGGPFMLSQYSGYTLKQYFSSTGATSNEMLYYRDGLTSTVSVHRSGNNTYLKVNGKSDASSVADISTQVLSAYLPLALKADAEDVFIVGLGSGTTTGAALEFPVKKVRTVEIEPSIIEAAEFFADINGEFRRDPRSELFIEDARNFMLRDRAVYDVIVSEPSNPWMSGAAGIFTIETFRLMRGRLKPGGIVCQWIHGYSLSEQNLFMIIATFKDVFPQTYIFRGAMTDFFLIGSVEPLHPNLKDVEKRFSGLEPAGNRLRSLGLYDAASMLISSYIMGPAEVDSLVRGVTARNTDDRPLLEFRAPLDLYIFPYDFFAYYYLDVFDEIPGAFGASFSDLGPLTFFSLGNQLDKRFHSPSKSEEMYLKAIELDGNFAPAMTSLADLYWKEEKFYMAEEYFARALEVDPDDDSTRINLARLYIFQKLFDKAEEQLLKLMNKDLYYVSAMKYMGDIHYFRKNYAAALDKYGSVERLIAREGGDRLKSIYMSIISVAEESGDEKLTKEYLEKLYALDPNDAGSLLMLGRFHLERGEPDRAESYIVKAADIDPGSEEVKHLLFRLSLAKSVK